MQQLLNTVVFVGSVFLLGSCHSEAPTSEPTPTKEQTTTTATTTSQKLSFVTTTIQETIGDCKESCLEVNIAFPSVKEGDSTVQQNINSTIEAAIIETLDPGEPGESNPSIEIALDDFIDKYNSITPSLQGEKPSWAFRTNGKITHASNELIAIRLNEQIKNGGDKPTEVVVLFNFDPSNGQQLGIQDLISDTQTLQTIAEKNMRQQLKLSANAPFSKAGIQFPNNQFAVSGNVSVDKENLILYYTPMELGEKRQEALEIKISKNEVKQILKRN
ncbi:MAG: hypothetical protein JNM36_04835 [Chitinophagales bacterium]|jgi:hypothetical protein|nr:hypothetical protein [Chitinophagales bacterium]